MIRKSDPLFDVSFAIRIVHSTLIGPLALAAAEGGLVRLTILAEDEIGLFPVSDGIPASQAIAERAVAELKEYFTGNRQDFSIPVSLNYLTDFQRCVLEETARIPYGEVFSYGQVAARIGKPKAARAVGGALSRNPVAIVIPCHRVVAHDGRLHGFSSPEGLLTKAQLLRHEGVHVEDEKVFTLQNKWKNR